LADDAQSSTPLPGLASTFKSEKTKIKFKSEKTSINIF